MSITPYLLYEDVGGALKFLSKAFGFRKHGRAMSGPDGKLNHAAMKLGQDFLFVIGRHNHREKEALSNGDNSDVIVGHRMSARSATDEMRIPNAAR